MSKPIIYNLDKDQGYRLPENAEPLFLFAYQGRVQLANLPLPGQETDQELSQQNPFILLPELGTHVQERLTSLGWNSAPYLKICELTEIYQKGQKTPSYSLSDQNLSRFTAEMQRNPAIKCLIGNGIDLISGESYWAVYQILIISDK